MPKFNNKSLITGKKARPQVGVVTSAELKKDLETLAKYYKRTLSDFCKIELEKVVELPENQGILQKTKQEEDK
jgi:mRNA-degrading endonuclease RelE of RelBE toxin-antitoxin system